MQKTKNSPFSVNFRKLQLYNFKFFNLQEIILFEYFMLLAQVFKYKQFYHSVATINRETGIKRTAIESAIVKFESLGILDCEVKGMPKVKHFTVDIPFVMQCLPQIFQFAENNKLFDEIGKLYAEIYQQFVETCKQENIDTSIYKEETKKETKEKKRVDGAIAKNFKVSGKDVIDFVERLEKEYNQRRDYMGKKKDKKYPYATLGHKNASLYKIAKEALETIDQAVIINAWLVYNDKLFRDQISVTKILPYFFSKKEGEFDVIGNMSDIHNMEYTYSG